MSYGRSPYYIIGTSGHGGVDIIQFMNPMGSISRGEFPYPPVSGSDMGVELPDEAVGQLIAHFASRGSAHLQHWIDLGAGLDDDYTGFNAKLSAVDKAEATRFRNALKTTVQVFDRKGRLLK